MTDTERTIRATAGTIAARAFDTTGIRIDHFDLDALSVDVAAFILDNALSPSNAPATIADAWFEGLPND